jgi:hypothetical protein
VPAPAVNTPLSPGGSTDGGIPLGSGRSGDDDSASDSSGLSRVRALAARYSSGGGADDGRPMHSSRCAAACGLVRQSVVARGLVLLAGDGASGEPGAAAGTLPSPRPPPAPRSPRSNIHALRRRISDAGAAMAAATAAGQRRLERAQTAGPFISGGGAEGGGYLPFGAYGAGPEGSGEWTGLLVRADEEGAARAGSQVGGRRQPGGIMGKGEHGSRAARRGAARNQQRDRALQARCKPAASPLQARCKPAASQLQASCKPAASQLQASCKPARPNAPPTPAPAAALRGPRVQAAAQQALPACCA